jgi:hypothetical protein
MFDWRKLPPQAALAATTVDFAYSCWQCPTRRRRPSTRRLALRMRASATCWLSAVNQRRLIEQVNSDTFRRRRSSHCKAPIAHRHS